MRHTVSAVAVPRQSSSVDADRSASSTSVDTALALLRKAIHDRRWTLDALAAAMKKDKSLISRVLNGERPLTLDFQCALPDDVEALWHQSCAEGFGLIVVEPLNGADAKRAFVAGLFGMLNASALPEKAGSPAKADLKTDVRKEGAA